MEEMIGMEEGIMEGCPEMNSQLLEVGMDETLDECIRTISCEGNCTSNSNEFCNNPAR